MFIKKLILDGFKSYGKRTEIDGFDKEFTAITGLNGTGKSNILDSICFVLGITNLGQVRATSLQELIFKNGQAGITKASVTIVFDNTDSDNCPVGYENCKEITVSRQVCVGGGGKNKYFINGRTVLNKKVADLFCSIQMNVNNPNFLIMQGRITKVLNMKPMEILSMIEEASGTSLYESKREQTTKVIEKKDSKLKEMDSLLQEEINPRMEKLRSEQKQYDEFQKLKREIDHLTHIYYSYKYLMIKEAVQKCGKSVETVNTFIADSRKEIENNIKETEEIDAQCKEMQERIDAETGGELAVLEQELAVKSKTEATANGAKKSASQEVDAEKRKLKLIQKNLSKDEDALQAKQAKIAKVGDLFQSLREADEADSKAFSDAQKRFQAVSAGLEMNADGQSSSLQEQLTATKTKLSEATTTIKKSEMDLKYMTKQLQDKEKTQTKTDSSYQKNKENLELKEKEIKTIEQRLNAIDYEDGTIEALEKQRDQLNDDCRNMSRELDRKGGHRFEVQYRDPEPNFDRCSVKGMVCKLFDVKDPKYYVALSTCGGGHLFNLVVDNEHVSKKILERGQLQTRITIIPITKIRGSTIEPNKVKMAQQMVGTENCIPALDLITYHPSLKVVMQYVFGRAFICTDLTVAKQVTYNNRILTRSITLDGDVLEPEGTLSGGAQSQQTPILVQVAEIKDFSKRLDAKRAELRNVQDQITKVQGVANQYNQLKRQLDATNYERESIKQLLAQTTYQKHQQEIEDLRNNIETLKTTIKEKKEEQVDCNAKIKEMEANLADAKGYRDRQLKEAKDNMQKMKEKAEKSRKEWEKHEKEAETLRLEVEGLKESIEKAQEEIATTEAHIQELQKKLDELIATSETASKEISELKQRIKNQKDSIASKHMDLKKNAARKEKLLKRNDELELTIKKKETELSKFNNEVKEHKNHLATMKEQHKWIETDETYFGCRNTKYDYSKEDPKTAGERLRQKTEKYDALKKRINEKAMMLLEREEEELKSVCDRKGIVELDRKKIKGILKGLDAEKMELLRKAWKEVDTNFGSIFSVLLPGAQATLVPSPDMEFYQGLNIKVGFNGVWKESLTELSGGQRSLVALSLILAMLKYKPAPIYILDEVDAALDMSHTQNIGRMLKMHFTNSQFIIVSLKDGMFNNANVIFKTKFENGVSGVIRTQNVRNK